jgi:hypothetical protein
MPVSKIPGAGISGGSVVVNQTAPDNSLVVNASGNVGVGTASPAQKFVISESGTNFVTSVGGGVQFVGTTTNNSIALITNSVEAIRITSAGNVLVGRTTQLASEKFVVSQSANAVAICAASNSGPSTGNYESSDIGRNAYWNFGRDNQITGNFVFASNGNARANIDATTGAYTAVSDSRLKKEITDLSYGLNEVMAMRPVMYLMNEEEDTAKKHIGFIAQEVKAVMDEAVDDLIDHDTQFYGLDKSGLVPVLVKAIQEQQAMITELKARIETLEGNK